MTPMKDMAAVPKLAEETHQSDDDARVSASHSHKDTKEQWWPGVGELSNELTLLFHLSDKAVIITNKVANIGKDSQYGR